MRKGRKAKLAATDVGCGLGVSVRPPGQAVVVDFEKSLALYGPPGSGKTLRVLVPILRTFPGPALVTSTKPDIYETTVAMRRKDDRPVAVLDTAGMVPGAPRLAWSVVRGCADTRTAERRANALLATEGSDMDHHANARFFRQSAVSVLKTLLQAADLDGRTMADVRRWCRNPTDPRITEVLDTYGDRVLRPSGELAQHTTGAEVTTSGVMRSVQNALACFDHRDVLDLTMVTEADDFDIAGFLAERGTIYLLGKGKSLGSATSYITALAEEVAHVAERMANQSPTRRLDPPFLLCLDEAPNVAPLPSLPDRLADGRGRGEVVIYTAQSPSQVRSTWGAEVARSMDDSTSITGVFGGLTDNADLRAFSALCGTTRVRATSENHHDGGRSVSAHFEDQPVLRPEEIHTLPKGHLLLFIDNLHPIVTSVANVMDTHRHQMEAEVATVRSEMTERHRAER